MAEFYLIWRYVCPVPLMETKKFQELAAGDVLVIETSTPAVQYGLGMERGNGCYVDETANGR